jgi:peptide/nickel transport system substrate-binding protein
LSAEDVQAIVAAAISNIPEGISPEDVQAIVSQAISEIPEGLTATQMEAAIRSAVDQGVKDAVASAVAQIPPTATPLPAMFGGVTPFGGIVPMLAYDSPNPHFIWGGVSYKSQVHLKPVFNMTIDWDHSTPEKLDWKCDLCSDWSVSDDGITYTFTVNPDAKWHDGEDVGADDLVNSFNIWLDPKGALDALNPAFADVPEEIAGVGQSALEGVQSHLSGPPTMIDENTFSVSLNDPPSGVFLNDMLNQELMILPKHLFERGVLPANPTDKDSVIGSGPYRFVEYTTDVSTVLERNPDYFKSGLPYLDGIEHFIITSASGRASAAFETEQVLMSNSFQASLNAAALLQLEKDTFGSINLHWQGPLYAYSIHFNTRVAPFNDPRVRKGMQLGIHRQPYLKSVTADRGGMGTPLPDGFPWSYTRAESDQFPGFRESSAGVKHPDDIAAAKALFEAAGYGEGTKVTLTCSTSLAYCDVGIVIKGQFLEDFGWTINIDAVRGAVAREKYTAGDYQFNIQATGFSFPHPSQAIRSQTSGRNAGWTGVTDPDNPQHGLYLRLKEIYDTMLLASDQNDPTVRELMQEVHNLQIEDPYIIPMLYVTQAWPVSKRIKGFYPPPVVTGGNTHETIWCNPDCP